jgi:hypothetical protein
MTASRTQKVEILVDADTVKEAKRWKEKKTVHKVQMLDVATALARSLPKSSNRFTAGSKARKDCGAVTLKTTFCHVCMVSTC